MSFETLGKYEKVYQIQGLRKPNKQLKHPKRSLLLSFQMKWFI